MRTECKAPPLPPSVASRCRIPQGEPGAMRRVTLRPMLGTPVAGFQRGVQKSSHRRRETFARGARHARKAPDAPFPAVDRPPGRRGPRPRTDQVLHVSDACYRRLGVNWHDEIGPRSTFGGKPGGRPAHAQARMASLFQHTSQPALMNAPAQERAPGGDGSFRRVVVGVRLAGDRESVPRSAQVVIRVRRCTQRRDVNPLRPLACAPRRSAAARWAARRRSGSAP